MIMAREVQLYLAGHEGKAPFISRSFTMVRKFILAVATVAALIVGFCVDASPAQARPYRGYYGYGGYGPLRGLSRR